MKTQVLFQTSDYSTDNHRKDDREFKRGSLAFKRSRVVLKIFEFVNDVFYYSLLNDVHKNMDGKSLNRS